MTVSLRESRSHARREIADDTDSGVGYSYKDGLRERAVS